MRCCFDKYRRDCWDDDQSERAKDIQNAETPCDLLRVAPPRRYQCCSRRRDYERRSCVVQESSSRRILPLWAWWLVDDVEIRAGRLGERMQATQVWLLLEGHGHQAPRGGSSRGSAPLALRILAPAIGCISVS